MKNIRLIKAKNARRHPDEAERVLTTRLGGAKGSFTILDIASSSDRNSVIATTMPSSNASWFDKLKPGEENVAISLWHGMTDMSLGWIEARRSLADKFHATARDCRKQLLIPDRRESALG